MTSDDLVFAHKSTNNIFLGQLMDCTNPLTPIPYNLTGYDKVYLIFKKPNGELWPTDEQIESGYDQGAIVENADGSPDPVDLENANIKLFNGSSPSILDQKQNWEYTPAAKIGNTIIKSPIKIIFWVE